MTTRSIDRIENSRDDAPLPRVGGENTARDASQMDVRFDDDDGDGNRRSAVGSVSFS